MESTGAFAAAALPAQISLSYTQPLVCWLILIALGWSKPKVVFSRSISGFVYWFYLLAVVELSCIAGVAAIKGNWIRELMNENWAYFQEDPYTIGALRPSVSGTRGKVTISHNSQGFRGHLPRPDHSAIRIVAIGGSTTYGVGVNDTETWPVYLEAELGDRYEVLNLGVPAHATTEHLGTAAFKLPELKPDIVVLHVGLNDLHVMHAPGLRPDYANVHAVMLKGNLGLCFENSLPPIATLHLAVIALQKIGVYPVCETFGPASSATALKESSLDAQAAEYYRRNLGNLIAITKRWSKRTIVVPQVLNEERLADGGYEWWVPYIAQDALPALMSEYNRISMEVAKQEGVEFARSVVDARWERDQFVDHSHLGSAGNLQFAKLLASQLKDE